MTFEKGTDKEETILNDQQVAKEKQKEQPPEEKVHPEGVQPGGEVHQEQEVRQEEIPQQQELPANEEHEKPTKEQPAKENIQEEPVNVPSSSSLKRKLTFATDFEAKKSKVSETMVDISRMSTRQLKELTTRKHDMILSCKKYLVQFCT